MHILCIQTRKLLINNDLHNIEEISNAIKKITNPKHIGFGMRKNITYTTCKRHNDEKQR